VCVWCVCGVCVCVCVCGCVGVEVCRYGVWYEVWGVRYRVWGIGYGARGIGYGAWGMRHGVWGTRGMGVLHFTFPNAPMPSVFPSLYWANTIGTLSIVLFCATLRCANTVDTVLSTEASFPSGMDICPLLGLLCWVCGSAVLYASAS
jgi:hypothetical protein